MKKDKQIPKGYSSRKGCYWCKQPLNTLKEKVLRTCNECAKDTLDSFNKMSEGKIKEGFTEVKDKVFGKEVKTKTLGTNINKVISYKEKEIIKKAKKKGYNETQIQEALDTFRKLEK